MKLIVGLGNPGDKYQATRHNCGFMVIDKIAEMLNVRCDKLKFKAAYTKVKYKNQDIILLKPLTFMNLSGQSIIEAIQFFKIDLEDIVVIYDDLDLPVGKIRLRESGGSGGHNGIKSIIQYLNTQDFKRIRVGIDKSPVIPVIDYVLTKFSKQEEKDVNQAIDNAAEAALLFASDSFTKSMNGYN